MSRLRIYLEDQYGGEWTGDIPKLEWDGGGTSIKDGLLQLFGETSTLSRPGLGI